MQDGQPPSTGWSPTIQRMVTHHPKSTPDQFSKFQQISIKPGSIRLCSLTVSAWTEPQISPACWKFERFIKNALARSVFELERCYFILNGQNFTRNWCHYQGVSLASSWIVLHKTLIKKTSSVQSELKCVCVFSCLSKYDWFTIKQSQATKYSEIMISYVDPSQAYTIISQAKPSNTNYKHKLMMKQNLILQTQRDYYLQQLDKK